LRPLESEMIEVDGVIEILNFFVFG
jgi:hypothetical protein